jgi:TPR repeat protein
MSESIEGIQESALSGNPQAQYELGQMFEFGRGVPQDFAEALKLYLLAAKQEFSKAEYALGLLYEHGRGVEANPSTAADWYEKAAEKGDTWAMNNLAMVYSYGKGRDQSESMANELYLRAAKLGHFQAQYNLAARYASGRGFEMNLIESFYWFERSKLGASALNQERANKMLEAIKEHMPEEDILQAQTKVNQIFTPID